MIRNQEPTAVLTAIVIAIVSVGCLLFVVFARVQEEAIQTPASEIAAAEMSGWETYTNTDYGFQLDYPPGWSLDTSGLQNVTPFIAFGNPLSGTKTYSLEVFIQNDPSGLSSGEYVHLLLANDRAQDAANSASGPAPTVTPQYSKTEILSVGESTDYEAYELYGVFEFDHNAEQIYVTHGTTALRFDFPIAQENPNISLPVANNAVAHEIINTLVFTK